MLLSKLIPSKQMYKYKWFVTSDHQDWYYYVPRKNIDFIKNSESIYNTLDNNLKDIFDFSFKKGYITLPSCEGHFFTEKNIKNKYNSVIKDFIKITTDFINLKDLESNKKYNYSNVNYKLPWKSFNDFKLDINKNMNVGYFGIVNANGIAPLKLDNVVFDIEKINNDNQILHITVYNNSPQDISNNWKKVHHILKNNLL